MFSQDDESPQRVALTVVGLVVGAMVLSVLAFAMRVPAASRAPAPSSAPAPAAEVAMPSIPAVAPTPPATGDTPTQQSAQSMQAQTDAASVKVERNVVKFYFASGRSDLAAGAADALVGLVRASGPNGKFVVSGFHDTSGDPARNAELAKRRAVSVRDALVGLGVTEQQIELRKPESIAAAATDPEARRVEITLR
ncbi:OmpA family protein [Polaromonas sp. YR568]|uniref:OmpA family protein n=1 Tax=Polaromonas sp. YR568 TaxID=1855301 RepID=UPI0031377EF9